MLGVLCAYCGLECTYVCVRVCSDEDLSAYTMNPALLDGGDYQTRIGALYWTAADVVERANNITRRGQHFIKCTLNGRIKMLVIVFTNCITQCIL